jgi:ferredoxin
MNIRSLTLAFFSPTGTTRAVLKGIARGLGMTPRVVDVTTPVARTAPLAAQADELLVLGVPVYMGRVPDLLSVWLQQLDLRGTPTVCVVVFGNRAYESALRELRDIVASRGGIPVAGAAFIGEHSFSSPDLPASVGRPDGDDLRRAEDFGRRIDAQLRSVSGLELAGELPVPGSFPYGGITKLWDVDFIQVGDGCVQCGTCADRCPMGAIDRANSAAVDTVKCITCCACIKACPEQARSKKAGPVLEASRRVHGLYAVPKEPEFFFPTTLSALRPTGTSDPRTQGA